MKLSFGRICLIFVFFIFKTNISAQQVVVKRNIFGDVRSNTGESLPFVSILYKLKNQKLESATMTDSLGHYSASIPNDADSIVFSSVHYRDTSISLNSNNKYDIVLENKNINLDDVTITNGLFSRKKESFTGAVSTYTGQQLKQISNGNVIQSLKTLDPSFIVVTNNVAGSNPNVMPNIELRGKSSVPTTSSALNNTFSTNPNMPLFILDGFETTLEQIVDMDMNRIQSITLLKDAASTAIYGGKAANGVVVIETKKPKAGQLRVSYTNDFRMELPDLTGYNMMDAKENLAFQKLAGMYDVSDFLAYYRDSVYNERLKAVDKGLNTYWLTVPLRKVGITEGHSIDINGGSENFQFDMGLNYKTIKGLMKGSNRDTWGGNVKISYRLKNINFINNVYMNGYKLQNSPYGDFSTYVNISPYFEKYDSTGQLRKDKYLFQMTGSGAGALSRISNPIYNSTLNSLNTENSYTINDNFGIIWTVNHDLQFQAGGQVIGGITTSVIFISPDNTIYDNNTYDKKGSYTNSETKQFLINLTLCFLTLNFLIRSIVLLPM